MPTIPSAVLKKLYVQGSLRAEGDGFALDLKNMIAPATITACTGLDVDGQTTAPEQLTLVAANGNPRPAERLSRQAPVRFPVGAAVTLHVAERSLQPGHHELLVHIMTQEIGPLDIPISDTLA